MLQENNCETKTKSVTYTSKVTMFHQETSVETITRSKTLNETIIANIKLDKKYLVYTKILLENIYNTVKWRRC